MIRTTIKAGVCGLTTVVSADSEDMQNVSVTVETDCEKIKKLAASLPTVDAYAELGAGLDGVIFSTVRENPCCLGCIVPCGISKSVQVAAGLMLPGQASIDIERS